MSLSRRLNRAGLQALALVLAALCPVVVPAAEPVERTALQAAYVMNFLRYSEWPAPARTSEEVTLLVIAPPSQVRAFRATADAAGARGGRVVRVRGLDPARAANSERLRERIDAVHAVFVAGDEDAVAEAVIAAARGKPVLTIGEGRGFVQRGGMLSFLPEGRHLVFTSNLQAVLDSPVTLSSRVLRLAREPTGLPAEGARQLPIDDRLAMLWPASR